MNRRDEVIQNMGGCSIHGWLGLSDNFKTCPKCQIEKLQDTVHELKRIILREAPHSNRCHPSVSNGKTTLCTCWKAEAYKLLGIEINEGGEI